VTAPRWGPAALVAAVATLVHARSIAFDFTYLDDRDFIVDDHAFLARAGNLVRAFARPYMNVVDGRHAYYRPLVTVSYGVDAQWSGLHPFGYHATNVVLHAVASVLLYALLRRVAFRRTVAVVAALVFAVHPLLASAVAWIPGRNDSLLAVFALASWLAFSYALVQPAWPALGLHIAFFWLALLTKESAVVIPLVCIAHVVLMQPEALRRLARGRAMFVVIGGWCLAIAGRLFAHPLSGGANLRDFVHNLPLFVMGLGQIVAPFNPSLIAVREDLSSVAGLAAVCLVASATFFVPGVRTRVVLLGTAVFVLFLAPAMTLPGGLVNSGRLYVPACGVIVAVAEIVRALVPDRLTFVAFAGVTDLALAAIAMAYEGTFRDRRAFARGAVAASPHSPLAHFCLGQTYQLDGDVDRALAEYHIALGLGATEVVHNNIAVVHMADARWQDAELELRAEIENNPGYARAYRNLGIVLRHQGRVEEASEADDRARVLATDDSAP
jgi:hypothetical protein